MLTKLRPFVRKFLEEASNMFEMYIYTMGDKAYAIEIAKLLDPGNVYFGSKVISNSDWDDGHCCPRSVRQDVDAVDCGGGRNRCSSK